MIIAPGQALGEAAVGRGVEIAVGLHGTFVLGEGRPDTSNPPSWRAVTNDMMAFSLGEN